MKIKLNRTFFARNRYREKEYDDMFSVTYRSLSGLSNIVFFIIFRPVIVIGNLFSQGVFLSLMNIVLAVGYCDKFIQKIEEGEINGFELGLSLVFLCLSLAITFYLAPAISLVQLIDGIGLINLVATGINSFFLVRSLVIPPCERLLQHACTSLGYDVTMRFFNKAPFTLEKDRPVLDRLLRKYYKHSSRSDAFQEHQIEPFNHVLSTLCQYINKYNDTFLGNLINHERITYLENAVAKFIIDANTDSSFAFINKKIDFKHTKIETLILARDEFIKGNSQGKRNFNYSFFETHDPIPEKEEDEMYNAGLSLLTDEIERQTEKVKMLKSCVTFS